MAIYDLCSTLKLQKLSLHTKH